MHQPGGRRRGQLRRHPPLTFSISVRTSWNQRGHPWYQAPHFASEKVEAQRVSTTCPKPPIPPRGWEQDLNPTCQPPVLLTRSFLLPVLRLPCLGQSPAMQPSSGGEGIMGEGHGDGGVPPLGPELRCSSRPSALGPMGTSFS